MTKLFKIMDESGDGKLGTDEIILGFFKVAGEEIDGDLAEEIQTKIDFGNKGYVDFHDFITSSINYKDTDAFMSYMTAAYKSFFDNELESVDTQELIDLFCSEKEIKNDFVKQIMKQIDSDDSNTITACEFITAVVENLAVDQCQTPIRVVDVIKHLKFTMNLQVG